MSLRKGLSLLCLDEHVLDENAVPVCGDESPVPAHDEDGLEETLEEPIPLGLHYEHPPPIEPPFAVDMPILEDPPQEDP